MLHLQMETNPFKPLLSASLAISAYDLGSIFESSLWHVTPSILGLAELRGPYTVLSHLPCCPAEGWCRREWWEQGEQPSSLLLQHRSLPLQAGKRQEGVSAWPPHTDQSPLVGPWLPIIPTICNTGETASTPSFAEVQAGRVSLGSQSTRGCGEMANSSLSTDLPRRAGDWPWLITHVIGDWSHRRQTLFCRLKWSAICHLQFSPPVISFDNTMILYSAWK